MTSVMRSMYWLCRSWGRRGTAAYLTDWVRGMVRMYTESATRYRTDTLNAVTGRSASITVDDVAGVTSVSQGDAASCRRNVVYAWMSTVLPVIQTRTTGVPVVRVWITGSTVDIQAYTTFLRQLAASPWLTDVTPATSSTVIEADRPVTAFNVSVRYRVADSVYIRTQPVARSVR